jgi:uncharacterized UBP type Zn finger protein
MAIHDGLGSSFPGSHTFIQLVNKDGDCYINSVLQSLYNLRAIEDHCWTCQRQFDSRGLTNRAEQSLFGFFVRIYVDSMRAPQNEVWYEPNYFLDNVFKEGVFQRGVPSDAAQFFLFLANALDAEAAIMNSEHNRPVFPTFSDLFKFEVKREFRHSGRVSFADESCTVCGLPMGDSVASELRHWTQEFRPDGSCALRKFTRYPRVFVCQMMNCQFGADGNLHKIFAPMEIQDRIVLEDRTGNRPYELKSVVMHNGVDVTTGHYFCIFRAAGRWILGDDAMIRGLSDDETADFLVNGHVSGYDQATLALLFYEPSG